MIIDFVISEKIKLPDLIYCDIAIDGIEFQAKPALYWKKEKIYVFESTDAQIIQQEKNIYAAYSGGNMVCRRMGADYRLVGRSVGKTSYRSDRISVGVAKRLNSGFVFRDIYARIC